MVEIDIPEETIRRLMIYLRYLTRLLEAGQENISSGDLANILGINSHQIRKDLSYFGEFGTRGVGYETKKLVREIRFIFKLNKKWEVALVGVGNIGSALLRYPGFKKQGMEISLAFDRNSQIIGKEISGVAIENVCNLEKRVKENGIMLGIVAVPPPSAQEVAEALVSGGVTGILNFAPTLLDLPEKIKIAQVDIAVELGRLIYYVQGKT